MEEIKELAKCVKCNEFSEVDTDIALMSNPPQYQFTCSSCSNKQFIWGSFIYRIPRSILAKADEYESNKWRTHVNDLKAEAFDAILKSYDEALSEGHMADEVINIIEKYESGERNE